MAVYLYIWFNRELSLAPWSGCSVSDDIDDCVAAWEHLYKNIIKEMVPEMKAKIRNKSVPWETSEIREADEYKV